MRVKVRAAARHVPPEHRGEEAEVVDTKRLSFGVWYRLRFDDGSTVWTTPERVEEV